jgi:predicted PhzF superfamily epimerase YddE/YHI9
MHDYAFRIVNVFAEERLGGNPLAVVEDGRALDDATMQAIALQFNLSETTFILPSSTASKRGDITPTPVEKPLGAIRRSARDRRTASRTAHRSRSR